MKKFILLALAFTLSACDDDVSPVQPNQPAKPVSTDSGSTNTFDKFTVSYSKVTDPRDGQKYKTVIISGFVEGRDYYGTLVRYNRKVEIMAENLRYAGENNDIGVCDKNDSGCAKYGRYYGSKEVYADDSALARKNSARNFNMDTISVQGICPDGWGIMNTADFSLAVNVIRFNSAKFRPNALPNKSNSDVLKFLSKGGDPLDDFAYNDSVMNIFRSRDGWETSTHKDITIYGSRDAIGFSFPETGVITKDSTKIGNGSVLALSSYEQRFKICASNVTYNMYSQCPEILTTSTKTFKEHAVRCSRKLY